MKFTLTWAIDDQNLKRKRPTNIMQNISKKIQANSRRHLSMELLLCKIKDHLYVLPRIISKMSYLLQFQVIVSMLVLPKMTVKFLLWMTVMLIKFKETISKAVFRSFSGANTKQLDQYILRLREDDKPDAVIIHVGTNNILNNVNHEYIARNIIKIYLNCKKYGVNDIFIFSILVKKSPNLDV